jgi:hypothetical protein
MSEATFFWSRFGSRFGSRLRSWRRTGACGAAGLLGAALVLAAMAPGAAAVKAPSKLSMAIALGSESTTQVVTLHDMAKSLGDRNGMSANAVRGPVGRLKVSFQSEAKVCEAIGAPAKSPTGELATSLAGYAVFAAQVVSASTKGSFPAGFVKKLTANDKVWLQALAGLDKAGHVDLLKEVPSLLYPSSGKVTSGRG